MEGPLRTVSVASSDKPGPYEQQLIAFCRNQNLRTPTFQIISDRRGGRTAWSCEIILTGGKVVARFWYDGLRANQAREDAAQVALEQLRQIPPQGVSPELRMRQLCQGNPGGFQQQS